MSSSFDTAELKKDLFQVLSWPVTQTKPEQGRPPAPISKEYMTGRVVFFILAFAALVFIHQARFDDPTPVSRLDCLHAIVAEGTLAIDHWRTNTPDVAFANEHYYSDKAPGTIVLALPGFLIGSALLKAAGEPLESKRGWLVTSWTACAGIALIVVYGLLKLSELLGKLTRPRIGYFTAAAIWFGAAPLPYSTLLFSHAQVVACIAIGLFALCKAHPEVFAVKEKPNTQDQKRRWLVFAGFMFGWALNSEYTSGLVVVGASLAIIGSNWRDYRAVILGMVAPLLLIPLYSWLTVGSPFILPYSYQAFFPQMKEGLYAIKWPDLTTAYYLTLGSSRGLFFWSPFLFCAFFGYADLLKKSPRLFWLAYLVPIFQVIVISGRVWDWPAGSTLGPRYLAPILPLLALPCAFAVQRFPKLSTALAVYSIGVTTLATLTDACPDFHLHPNPLFDSHIPLFLKGEFSPNLGRALGMPPYASVALFYGLLIGGASLIWRTVTERESSPLAKSENPTI